MKLVRLCLALGGVRSARPYRCGCLVDLPGLAGGFRLVRFGQRFTVNLELVRTQGIRLSN